MAVLYTIACIAGAAVLYRILRFITTPVFKSFGFYKYYSPMFFTFKLIPGVLDIHIGTSWDYMNLKNRSPKNIFRMLLEGFLGLCKEIESGRIKEDTLIKGNICYFKPGVTRKFGFNTRTLNLFESIFFLMNYIEMLLLRMLTTGKFEFIPLDNNRIHYAKAKDILSRKEVFLSYFEHFSKANEAVSSSFVRTSA